MFAASQDLVTAFSLVSLAVSLFINTIQFFQNQSLKHVKHWHALNPPDAVAKRREIYLGLRDAIRAVLNNSDSETRLANVEKLKTLRSKLSTVLAGAYDVDELIDETLSSMCDLATDSGLTDPIDDEWRERMKQSFRQLSVAFEHLRSTFGPYLHPPKPTSVVANFVQWLRPSVASSIQWIKSFRTTAQSKAT